MTTMTMGRLRTKYHNRKTLMFGILFDSGHEAERYLELRSMVEAGEIEDLQLQVKFLLKVKGQLICTYIADFVYRDGKDIVVEDAKGYRTKEYRLKKKLMQAVHGIEIKEV